MVRKCDWLDTDDVMLTFFLKPFVSRFHWGKFKPTDGAASERDFGI